MPARVGGNGQTGRCVDVRVSVPHILVRGLGSDHVRMLQLKLISLLSPLHACLPAFPAASSSECAPVFFRLYRPFDVDTAHTAKSTNEGYMKEGGGDEGGALTLPSSM